MKKQELNKLFLSALITGAGVLAWTLPTYAGMKEATAISTPSGDGQKVTAVAVRYDETIKGSRIAPEQFTVAGRTITSARVIRNMAQIESIPAAKAQNGNIVLLSLSADDDDAPVLEHVGREPSTEKTIALHVEQTQPVAGTWGRTVATGEIDSSKIIHRVADEFSQHRFSDPQTGVVVPYNLYIPKNYNPQKSYPLILFIHDAGSTNTNIRNTLLQGNGATTWAEPAFQARHEAFVLAPQYDHTIVNDNSDDPADLEPTINLIKSLSSTYNIDQNRLYTTGQSGGAMMSLAMNIKYPEFFAASYIVAGQWAADKTAPIAKNKLFILVSENDPKAFPGENAIINVLKQHGAVVAESHGWNASAPIGELNAQTEALIKQPANVYYATFTGGTLKREQTMPENKGAAHVGTWAVAYDIDAIKEWVFAQHK